MKMRTYSISVLFIVGLLISTGSAGAAGLGEEVIFNIDSGYDPAGRSQVTATLQAIGSHIYFYVENDYWQKLDGTGRNGVREKIEELAGEFDTVIYPKERAVFGSEWNPGVDNDSRITVLLIELSDDAGGYVRIYDEYPKSQVAISNEREMIYLNISDVSSKYFKSFLAHEFQHLITFYQKTVLHDIEEEIWLNEARSEYAPTVCGYNETYPGSYLANRIDLLLDSPTDPLGEWKNETDDYGVAAAFMHYLAGHYGSQLVTHMVLSDKIGMESINEALALMGYEKTFSDIFADWAVANYLNDCSVGDGKYCYSNSDLTYQRLHVDDSAAYSGFPNLIVTRSSSVKDWSPRWYRFWQSSATNFTNDALKLEFDGSSARGDFRIPYIVADNQETTVRFMSFDSQQDGAIYIPNFLSEKKSLVIIPFNQYQTSNFGSNEHFSSFTFTALSVANSTIPIIEEPELYPDGTLVRNPNAKGMAQFDIYIVKLINGKKFKRLILSPHVFESYEHFDKNGNGSPWDDVQEVGQSVMNSYTTSDLVRLDWSFYTEDRFKVYELSPSGDTGIKQWLNMSASAFTLAGYDPDSIYSINVVDMNAYITGGEITN